MHPRPRSPLILPVAVVVTFLYVGLVRLMLMPVLHGSGEGWSREVVFGLTLPVALQIVNLLLFVFLGLQARGLKRGYAILSYGAMVLVAYLAYAIWNISR